MKKNERSGDPTVEDIRRFRLVLSDGIHYLCGFLPSPLNHLVDSGELQEHCIIKLEDYQCNPLKNRVVLGMTSLQVLNGPVAAIGNATNVVNAASSGPHNDPPALETPKPYGSSSAVVQPRTVQEEGIVPISSLNPYNNHWKLKARVTTKSQMRTWNNSKGTGKLFSVDLLDDEDGEVRVTMFNDTADRLYDVFQVNKVFYVSGGSIKTANKKFSGHIKNDYEITLNNDADVRLAPDQGSIKLISYHFVPIASLTAAMKDTFVDILGIVTNVGPIGTIVSKSTNKEIKKRSITLADSSKGSVEVTLWNDFSENFTPLEIGNQNVLSCKNMRVSDFGGVSLGTSTASLLETDPDRSEAHQLRAWWDSEGTKASLLAMSSSVGGSGKASAPADRKLVSEVNDGQVGLDAPFYYDAKLTVIKIPFDMDNRVPWYEACPSASCNKKVVPDPTGAYMCEKCNKSYDSCEPRYIMSLQLVDCSDAIWVNAFNEVAVEILGNTLASDLKTLRDRGDELSIEKVMKKSLFNTFLFRVRAKLEDRQENAKVRHTLLSVSPLDPIAECKYLLNEIRMYAI